MLRHEDAAPGPRWKLFWPVLLLAFAARAAVALGGDFLLHPDETFQYLEPAHLWAHGRGVTFWEFFHGARSWLIPAVVAAVLAVFELLGLGQPAWYAPAVKLVFCALSLLIPTGMYFFSRAHFGERSARFALLAGAFWYELLIFAHKPMTEFVATGLLLAGMACCMGPGNERPLHRLMLPALTLLLAAAVRMQYLPLALAPLGLLFLRVDARGKAWLAGASALIALAVGIFDAASWDAGLFHSYITNFRFNVSLDLAYAEPGHQYLLWIFLASLGVGAASCVAGLFNLRRHGLLLLLIALALALHSAAEHKEYRFIFVVIPLWLMLAADMSARFLQSLPRRRVAVAGTVAALSAGISLAGLLEVLPAQASIYQRAANVRIAPLNVWRVDPLLAATRYLAAAPGVKSVWYADWPYYALPGYYRLHRQVPMYAGALPESFLGNAPAAISHIAAAGRQAPHPAYQLERSFGGVSVWRRKDAPHAPVYAWAHYRPVISDPWLDELVQRFDPDAPSAPPNFGIELVPPTPGAPD